MKRKAAQVFRVGVAIAVALAVSFGIFQILSVRSEIGKIETSLGEWANLVEEELMSPAPDPAELTRLTTDPATGDASVGLLILDSTTRPILSNRPEVFPPGSIQAQLAPPGEELERLQTDEGDLLILRRRLPDSAAVGESFAVFEEAPEVTFTLDRTTIVHLGAGAAGMAALLLLLYQIGGMGFAPSRRISPGASASSRDSLEIDPTILGALSREILQLARSLRDARTAPTPDETSRGWEKVDRRTSRLLEIAGDMASLAEMTGYSPPPTEAFSLEELLEDLVADGWGELEQMGIAIRIPQIHLLVEGDPRAFRRAIWGLIRHRFAANTDLTIEAGVERGRVWLTVKPYKATRGAEKTQPGLRGRLGLETARVLARACDGEVYFDAKSGAVTMRFSQWRTEEMNGQEE